MMQTTQPWHRSHLVTSAGIFLCFTTCRRPLFQREMGAVFEIVEDVFVHEAFQMPPIENDNMIEQIPAAGAYPAFRDTVRRFHSSGNQRGSSLFEIPRMFVSNWVR